MIVVGAVVPALRKAGITTEQLRAMARRYGNVSWAALVVIVVSGVLLRGEFGIPWSDGTLSAKLTLLALSIVVAAIHQVTARRTSPAVRGAIQGIILGLGVAIFGIAVML